MYEDKHHRIEIQLQWIPHLTEILHKPTPIRDTLKTLLLWLLLNILDFSRQDFAITAATTAAAGVVHVGYQPMSLYQTSLFRNHISKNLKAFCHIQHRRYPRVRLSFYL
ncbi:Hypothetical predicted protein [Octopus vulgaris]|uniref:Uncharacterized protein n=1 Tax=Octopus vulgaris TaxID=6645 RepID=A0AA36BH36_OCTVU|nr:Hypothetical predicted protein [Octopus vulgaris]